MDRKEQAFRKAIREEIQRMDETEFIDKWTDREKERLNRAGFEIHYAPLRRPGPEREEEAQMRDGGSMIRKIGDGHYKEEAYGITAYSIDELLQKMKEAGHSFEGNPQL